MATTPPKMFVGGTPERPNYVDFDMSKARSAAIYTDRVTLFADEGVLHLRDSSIEPAKAYMKDHFAPLGREWLNPAFVSELGKASSAENHWTVTSTDGCKSDLWADPGQAQALIEKFGMTTEGQGFGQRFVMPAALPEVPHIPKDHVPVQDTSHAIGGVAR